MKSNTDVKREKYRQTNAKHWCEYCKFFIMNNDTAKKRHEGSQQHQDAVKRHVSKLQKEEREKQRILMEFKHSSGLDFSRDISRQSSFYTKPFKETSVPVPLLSVKPPPVPKSSTMVSSSANVPRAIAVKKFDASVVEERKEEVEKKMASEAIVGQWEPVQPRAIRPINEFVVQEKIARITAEEPVHFAKRATTKRNIKK